MQEWAAQLAGVVCGNTWTGVVRVCLCVRARVCGRVWWSASRRWLSGHVDAAHTRWWGGAHVQTGNSMCARHGLASGSSRLSKRGKAHTMWGGRAANQQHAPWSWHGVTAWWHSDDLATRLRDVHGPAHHEAEGRAPVFLRRPRGYVHGRRAPCCHVPGGRIGLAAAFTVQQDRGESARAPPRTEDRKDRWHAGTSNIGRSARLDGDVWRGEPVRIRREDGMASRPARTRYLVVCQHAYGHTVCTVQLFTCILLLVLCNNQRRTGLSRARSATGENAVSC